MVGEEDSDPGEGQAKRIAGESAITRAKNVVIVGLRLP